MMTFSVWNRPRPAWHGAGVKLGDDPILSHLTRDAAQKELMRLGHAETLDAACAILAGENPKYVTRAHLETKA